MCAPIPLGMLRNENPHSRVFSARRALTIKSRQTTIFPPIPLNIPQNQAPQVEGSLALTVTDFPVTTPPITALSPDRSVSIPGLLSVNTGVQTLSLSITPSASTSVIATLSSSFNLPSSKTIVSTVLGSTTFSSATTVISTLSVSTYDTVTTTTPVTTITPETTITSVSQSSDSIVTTTSYTTSIESTVTDSYSTESFTLVPSSTITDTSSSIISSSTTNSTAPVANTVISSPISVTPANHSAHNPSFYVGIVLGTVAAIACLCALIAWLIRLRRHVRRRHAARSLKLPWAKPVDDSWSLESGHRSGSDIDIAAISAMNLGSREDLADVQAWSPRGDRDVGEPRRADSGNNGSTYSLQNHPIPEYCLFSDDSVRAFASSEGYSTASLLPHHNLRQLPSHLIDQELAARVSREHASLGSNDNIDGRMDSPNHANRDCGTPRETMNKPRFLSLRGNGLNVPWLMHPSTTRSMVERLRNHGKPAEPPWEQISSRRNLDEIDKKGVEAEEPWSASFKSSLVSAFNAVAANLSSAVGAPQMNGSGLTSAPSKRMTARRTSVRDTFWGEDVFNSKVKELSRETSVSTMTSKAWTLEETREGAGVVHLFIPSIQVCGEPVIQRPHLTGPTLSFGDGDDFVISDGDDDDDDNGQRRRLVDEHPQAVLVPLVASEKPPPPAVIRPDRYHHARRNIRKPINSSLLRRMGSNSSKYSTMSMSNNINDNIEAQTTGCLSIPGNNPYNAKDHHSSSDSIGIEPSQISRLSSSTTTTSTTILGTTGVIEALKDRRDRVVLEV